MAPGQPLVTVQAVDPAHLLDPQFALALALLTFGCQRDKSANGGDLVEFKEIVKGKPQRRFEFVFDPSIKVDGVEVGEWQRRWSDPAWRAENPGHPLRWMFEFAENYARFAEWMKAHKPLLVFRQADFGSADGSRERVAYLPEDMVGTERGNEILRRAGIAA